MAHHLPDNRAIFLFHKTLVVFQVWASPGEREVFLFTIGEQHFIDKLAAVSGINPQQGKREQQP